MDDRTLIAKRVAMELRSGYLVNLGIGLPTLVASLVPRDASIYFQSENGIIGMQAIPEEGLEAEDLTDAGGSPINALPGAATFERHVVRADTRRAPRRDRARGGAGRPQGPPFGLGGAGQHGARR